jgi:glycosyltransferase involved in cell wall biosynthesis
MIPCWNEEGTIASVIRRVPRELPGVSDVKVLVIDDGSEDDSPIAAVRVGADVVIRHKNNLGLGRTFRDGLEAGLRLGADIIVNIDADGQYDPVELPRLLDPILQGRADIVLGNRQVERLTHMPWSRRWGNRVASWVTRRISGLAVRDAQTGFRALTRDAAVRLTLNGGYTYTQEMIIQAAYRGLLVEEVPVAFERRSHGSSRLITSVWRYALRSGGIILRSYRDHNPMKVFALIGVAILAVGGLVGLRVLAHFLATGMVGPLLPSAILAAVLGVVGFQVIIFGLLADMLRAHRQIMEDMLLHVRKNEKREGDVD